MLFPVDMRDWLPEDRLVHFVIEAIEQIGVAGFKANRRGSGSEQAMGGVPGFLLRIRGNEKKRI